MLSGRSCILINSSSQIQFTSFVGTGGRLLASIKVAGLAGCLEGWVHGCKPMAMLHVRATMDPTETAVLTVMWRSGGGPNEWAGRRGMLAMEAGSTPEKRKKEEIQPGHTGQTVGGGD